MAISLPFAWTAQADMGGGRHGYGGRYGYGQHRDYGRGGYHDHGYGGRYSSGWRPRYYHGGGYNRTWFSFGFGGTFYDNDRYYGRSRYRGSRDGYGYGRRIHNGYRHGRYRR